MSSLLVNFVFFFISFQSDKHSKKTKEEPEVENGAGAACAPVQNNNHESALQSIAELFPHLGAGFIEVRQLLFVPTCFFMYTSTPFYSL